jgi:hypothetical protein
LRTVNVVSEQEQLRWLVTEVLEENELMELFVVVGADKESASGRFKVSVEQLGFDDATIGG